MQIESGVSSQMALYGNDPTERVVAVEPDYRSGVWHYRRIGESVVREQMPFSPWLLLTEIPAFELPGVTYTELEGEGYRILAEFETQQLYQEARFLVRDAHLAHLTYAGGAKPALIRSGTTLFKGMTFNDIVRMQFDLETNGLDPDAEGNRILLIAVADNRGLVDVLEGEERVLLERFIALVRERDPDVLEGHNLFGFDLPFLMRRAEICGIRLRLGRDGSEPRKGNERNYAIGGSSRPFSPIHIYGRHVVDTYLVVQRFDWAKQALSSYGLKECARVFGFAHEGRIELPRERMLELYEMERDRVITYARQDVLETQWLADLICPVEFYQAQMVPDNYGQVIVTGNGEKINSIFVRSYLAAGHGVPLQQPSMPYEGGYTEVRRQGVIRKVAKADVESLYPSLMLTEAIGPSSDTLGVFLPCLRDLTRRRLEAKRKAAESETNGQESHYWNGLQGSFKVLINSFYGYLGAPFYFNDYDAARRVTERGRELVKEIAAEMERTGSDVIEIDTDGVYFVPPPGVEGEEAERAYIAEVGKALPDGIRLAFDGRFASMLSLKTKNYVLVGYDGKKIYKGASLRSRADERYGRHFLTKVIDCLLAEDLTGASELYAVTIDDLLKRRIPIEDLARRERVTEKTFQSEAKKRSKDVAAGVAIGEHVMVYERVDGRLGLLADYADDENVKYYMEKLHKFARRLEEAIPKQSTEGEPVSFETLFPKPTAQGLPQKLQTTLDLF